MRAMNLYALTVETAGSSGGAAGGGALVSLIGINDTPAFRNRVLEQRDAIARTPSSTPAAPGGNLDTLEDIRDTLHRIEETLRNN